LEETCTYYNLKNIWEWV